MKRQRTTIHPKGSKDESSIRSSLAASCNSCFDLVATMFEYSQSTRTSNCHHSLTRSSTFHNVRILPLPPHVFDHINYSTTYLQRPTTLLPILQVQPQLHSNQATYEQHYSTTSKQVQRDTALSNNSNLPVPMTSYNDQLLRRQPRRTNSTNTTTNTNEGDNRAPSTD